MSFLILATVLLVAGCSEYDDSELRSRIEKVEQELSRAKSDIEALKTLVDIVQKNQEGLSAKVYVTKVEAFSEDGASGWIVYFTSGEPIKIYNGAAGKDGEKGADGKDGTDGRDGTDGKDGADGKDGTDGKDGDSLFHSVEVVGGNVVFTLADGTVYTIPLISVDKTVLFDEDNIVLSLGAVSDTHIGNEYGSEAKFTSAMTQLKNRAAEQDANGLDAVMIAGDLVNTANTGQISTLKTLYEQVFDPKKVPMIYTVGNHDMNTGYAWSSSTVAQNAAFHTILGDDYFLTDQDQTARKNFECRHCIVGNYHILCVTPNGSSPVVYDAQALTWLNSKLKAITEADPGRYVMVVTHPMIYNTVYGSDLGNYWYTTSLTSILEGYPQVVTFSGHLHFPLNDPRSVWQGAFTSFGCASVSYMAFEGGEYENKKSATVLNDAGEFSEGILIQLDASGNMKATRMDFYRNAVIGKPLYFKAPVSDKSHLERYNHTALSAANTAPVLSSVNYDNGTVTFAAGTDDEFVHHYDVSIKKGGSTVATKKIMSDFYRSPQTSMMKDSYSVTFDNLDEGDYTVSVVGVDSWGAASEPATKDFNIKNDNVADVTPYLGTYTLNAKIFEQGKSTISNGTVDITVTASGKTPNNLNISGLYQDAVLPARLVQDPGTGAIKLGLYFDGTKGQALTSPVTQSSQDYGYIAFRPGLGTGFVSGTYNFIPSPITADANYVWWWGDVSGSTVTFNADNKQALKNGDKNYFIIAISCVLSKTEALSVGNFAPTWNKVYQANPGDKPANGMTFTKK